MDKIIHSVWHSGVDILGLTRLRMHTMLKLNTINLPGLDTVQTLFQARVWTGLIVHCKCVLKYISLLFASQDSSSDDIWGPS